MSFFFKLGKELKEGTMLGKLAREQKEFSSALKGASQEMKLANKAVSEARIVGESVTAARAAQMAAAQKRAQQAAKRLLSSEKSAARAAGEVREASAVSIVTKPNGKKVFETNPNIHLPEVKPSELGYTSHGIDTITDKSALRAMIGEKKAIGAGLHEIESVAELRTKVKKILDEEGRLFNKEKDAVRVANNVAINGARAAAKRERSVSRESDNLMGCIMQRGGQACPITLTEADFTVQVEKDFFIKFLKGKGKKRTRFTNLEKAEWKKLSVDKIERFSPEQLKIYIRLGGGEIFRGIRNQFALQTIAKKLPDKSTSIDLLKEFQEIFINKITTNMPTKQFLAIEVRSTVSSLHNSALRDLERSGFTKFSKKFPNPSTVTSPYELDHKLPVHAICACLQKVMKDTRKAISEDTLKRLSGLLNDKSNLEWITSEQNKKYGREIKIGITELLKGTYTPPPTTDGMKRLRDGLDTMVDTMVKGTFDHTNRNAFKAIIHLRDVVKEPVVKGQVIRFLKGGGTDEELQEIKNIIEKFAVGLRTGNFDKETKEFIQIYNAVIHDNIDDDDDSDNDSDNDSDDEEDKQEYIPPFSKVFSHILNPGESVEESSEPKAEPPPPTSGLEAQQEEKKVPASTGLLGAPLKPQGGTRKNPLYIKSNTYRK